MRIGILGGTFDPIHLGHLVLAEEVKDELKLDKVIFIPAYIPPHKTRPALLDAKKRLEMVALATKGNRDFKVSRIEVDAKRKCFTVDTLQKFKKQFPKDELFFITGSDSLFELPRWKDIEEIFELATFVVGRRPGFPLEGVPHMVKVVKINPIDVSSSQLRKRIKERKSIRYLVPEAVRKYIVEKGLYRR